MLDIDFMNKHKIDFVAHDALPYSDASGQANDVYDFVSVHYCCHKAAAPGFSISDWSCPAGQEVGQVQGDTAHGWCVNVRHHLAHYQGLQRLCHAESQAGLLKERTGSQLCQGRIGSMHHIDCKQLL